MHVPGGAGQAAGHPPAAVVARPLSQVSPASRIPLPQTAGQSGSTLVPGLGVGQHPSPGAAVVIVV